MDVVVHEGESDNMSIPTCTNCRGPLPIDHAANLHPDGSRSCLGTCRPLYLFESGNPDWVVAHDEDDARALWCLHLGERPEDYVGDVWERLDDDTKSKFWLDPGTGKITDEGGVLTELTALEVVNRFGRGFVASVDF